MDLTACPAGMGVQDCLTAVYLAPWTGLWSGELRLANNFLFFCPHSFCNHFVLSVFHVFY